jgi:hypothetical protein
MPGHVTRAVARLSLRSGLDQACGSIVPHRKVLATGLSRLSKFPRIEASMAPHAWPGGCGQVVKQVVKHVVKAVGTGNNQY